MSSIQSTPAPAGSTPASSPASSVPPASSSAISSIPSSVVSSSASSSVSGFSLTSISKSSSSSTSATPSSSTSQSEVVVTSNGQLTTVVTVVVPPSQTSSSMSPDNTTLNHGAASDNFFDNKSAVAGVFSVVGLVGAVLLIMLLTFAIRRRRAKKFDEEITAVVAEADSRAARPGDYEYSRSPNAISGGAGASSYASSIVSSGYHGAPMAHRPVQPATPLYPMSELSAPSMYSQSRSRSPGPGSDNGHALDATGIGGYRSPSTQPLNHYGQFGVGPGVPDPVGRYYSPAPPQGFVPGPAPVSYNIPQTAPYQGSDSGHSQGHTQLPYGYAQESYASHYRPTVDTVTELPDPYAQPGYVNLERSSSHGHGHERALSAGDDAIRNPFAKSMEGESDEDAYATAYEPGRASRVLKVANE